MDDDSSDWLSGSAEPEPEAAPVAAAAAAEEPKGAAKPTRAARSSIIAPETEVEDVLKFLQVEAPKKQFNTHWARPRFLQYDYLYHYMHNYYDDYIDYLDRRMRGYEGEVPRPQTWAERALRTYTRNTYPNSVTYRLYDTRPPKPDGALLYTPHWANTWHSVHSKDFYNRKYKAILF